MQLDQLSARYGGTEIYIKFGHDYIDNVSGFKGECVSFIATAFSTNRVLLGGVGANGMYEERWFEVLRLKQA